MPLFLLFLLFLFLQHLEKVSLQPTRLFLNKSFKPKTTPFLLAVNSLHQTPVTRFAVMMALTKAATLW